MESTWRHVFTSYTAAIGRALDVAGVTFTVFLHTSRFSTFASQLVGQDPGWQRECTWLPYSLILLFHNRQGRRIIQWETRVFLELGFKGIGISCQNNANGRFSFEIVLW